MAEASPVPPSALSSDKATNQPKVELHNFGLSHAGLPIYKQVSLARRLIISETVAVARQTGAHEVKPALCYSSALSPLYLIVINDINFCRQVELKKNDGSL